MDSNRISGLIPPSLLGSFRFMRKWIAESSLQDRNNTLQTPHPNLNTSTGDLQLYNNLLTGPIPTEVGQLLFLNILYLDGNQLDAHLPTTLGALSNLGKACLVALHSYLKSIEILLPFPLQQELTQWLLLPIKRKPLSFLQPTARVHSYQGG